MTRNHVCVQCQITIITSQSVFFCVLTQMSFWLVVSPRYTIVWFLLNGRGVKFQSSLWENEVFTIHEFLRARLPMEVKCAVKFSIKDLANFI